MGSQNLASSLKSFHYRIDHAADFANRCESARHATANRPGLRNIQLEWVAEAALLKIVIASEQLFEHSMAMYVAGHKSPSGYRPGCLRRMNISISDARSIFKGDQNYVGWVDTSVVVRRAERWLKQGEPFSSILASSSTLLGYLRTMRNMIAHESDEARDKYIQATRRVYGSLPKRAVPGAQLLEPPPTSFSYLTGRNLLQATVATYRAIGTALIP